MTTEEPPLTVDDIPMMVAARVARLIVAAALPNKDGKTGDPDLAIDGVLMALAAFMEQAREFPTNQSLRKGSEDFAKRLAHHAKLFRGIYEDSGVHPLHQLIAPDNLQSPTASCVN